MRYLSYDKEKLETRLARLSGGVAEVYVGAHSVLEQKQKIHCYQKALKALQSAQRSGVVPGGGSAYRYVASRLERQHGNGYSDVVAKMLTEGLRVPERQLVKSVDGNPLLLRASTDECSNQSLPVFDVGRHAYIDSKKAGILDSAEITEEVVKRSISLAATMMRSDVCITNR